MYRRLSGVMFPILLVALIGMAVWGYQENKEKNSVLIKAENQYQRAFHDLTSHMGKLQTELGNTLAVNSTHNDMYRKGLVNIWRLTSQAQNEISQLPLAVMPFTKTSDFLDQISKFSYRTAVRDLSKKPMTEEERDTLFALYEHSKEISNELSTVQHNILSSNLRWMDVEMAIASEKQPVDNAILDGFQLVDKKIGEYPEIQWGPGTPGQTPLRSFASIPGEDVSAEQVRAKAAEFLGIQDQSTLQVIEEGKGTPLHSYRVVTTKPDSGQEVHIDYTKKGGQMTWYMAPRDVASKNIDIRGARDAALEFLDRLGFAEMSPISFDEYMNIASLTMVNRIGDVFVYPEKMVVEVALDTGEVIGLQTADYILEKKERSFEEPAMTEAEARENLNPEFEVQQTRLSLIRNEMDEEVLCYEFLGRVNGSRFKIFLNANDGIEERVEPIREQDVQAEA
ncbi:germination protein YpeB [Paenibacillus senegalensis]|uniref:germination protein YpeB n=1 Tax=Paenibacillus senegalensis TaxID=1465766 RepID=UPI000289A26F|nr:germination protein YpeB [Paenibacillus senegalensis]